MTELKLIRKLWMNFGRIRLLALSAPALTGDGFPQRACIECDNSEGDRKTY